MATTRGFVERIEAGRAGLVRVTVVNASGRTVFTISDIDGDPERFNERLTKVALCRDAMNDSEPVEVETQEEAEIDRVARISRDRLLEGERLDLVSGLVLKVAVESRNATTAAGEVHDNAQISLLGLDDGLTEVRLDLQAPERLVVTEQLRMLEDARASGAWVQLLVSTDDDKDEGDVPHVVSVWVGEDSKLGEEEVRELCGFVEGLGTLLPAGLAGAAASLALARITTGPTLTGPGGTVDPSPFAPETLGFLLARGSVVHALLEAAVRKNVRVRVRYLSLDRRRDDDEGGEDRLEEGEVRIRAKVRAAEVAADHAGYVEDSHPTEGLAPLTGLLLRAELQAPLSSASRPVWVRIDRDMLDKGPSSDCVPGVPSTSLDTRSLRDLRIPYRAEWLGHGCFNHGVYRFQVLAPEGTTLAVDGDPICLFGGDEEGVLVGYACLEGDHLVTVCIPEYVCDTEFELDAYRVR